MKLLRPLAGYTLYDHKTNDYIRRELRIAGILNKIDEYRWNWLSHLQRMPQDRIPLKSYHYRPHGRRTIGRPKKRWREQLYLWRRNGSKGPILDVYDDDDDDIEPSWSHESFHIKDARSHEHQISINNVNKRDRNE